MNATENTLIPLGVRRALADAALAYANALVTGTGPEIAVARIIVDSAAEDARICLKAAELGME